MAATERQVISNRKRRRRNRLFVWRKLTGKSCVGCGESDPIVLQFDHDDMATKILAIAEMVQRGCSLATIEEELTKCVVRCCNCHTRKTAVEMGWYDDKFNAVSNIVNVGGGGSQL